MDQEEVSGFMGALDGEALLSSVGLYLKRVWPIRLKEVQRQYNSLPDVVPLVLADLAQNCHMFDTSFQSTDPIEIAFNEGKRAVFLHIKEMGRLDDAFIDNLIEEINDERQRYKQSIQR